MKKSFVNNLIISQINDYFRSTKLDFLKKKTILITGATGFIGSYITLVLIQLSKNQNLNLNLCILYRNKKKILKKFGQFESKNVQFYKIENNKTIKLKKKINKIIHCASYASPTIYNSKFLEIYDANINLTIKLCELIKDQKNAELIYISSSEIYGDLKKKISEEKYGKINSLATRSCYALSKKIGENILVNYSKKFRLKYKILRLFHTVGWNSNINDGRLFFNLIKNFLSKKKTIKLISNGKNERAYCHILDAIEALFTIVKNDRKNNVYNIGNPKNTISILKLIKLFINITSINKKNIYLKKNANYSHTKNKSYYPNITKLLRLGWKPRFNLKDCIQNIWQAYLKLS